MEGVIFDINRFAIHDGPGIRTTVFLKGCPLTCFWCHNPESRRKGIEKVWSEKEKQYLQLGKKISVEELMVEIMADQIFYTTSNGGVTFSGGEPMMQLNFLHRALTACKEKELHTAVDTSGYVPKKGLARIFPLTDLFLFDLKMMDSKKHKKYTGVDNERILDNLEFLLSVGANVDLRIPLIPKINDSEEDLQALIDYILRSKRIQNIHLLPYHRTGQHKYKKFNLEIPEYSAVEPDDQFIQKQIDFFNAHGLEVIHGG